MFILVHGAAERFKSWDKGLSLVRRNVKAGSDKVDLSECYLNHSPALFQDHCDRPCDTISKS